MRANKYYVVYYLDQGNISVFHRWEETRRALVGRPNRYKGVRNRNEAIKWLDGIGVDCRLYDRLAGIPVVDYP